MNITLFRDKSEQNDKTEARGETVTILTISDCCQAGNDLKHCCRPTDKYLART